MKLFTGWVISAGLVVSAATANAQGAAPYEAAGRPYIAVSDVGAPYSAVPPEAPAPGYGYGPGTGPRYGYGPAPGYGYGPAAGYGYGPALLRPEEVYAVIRQSGFSPLGAPQQRGLFYIVAVIDRAGDDGRMVIDARNGRIIRFMPAYGMGRGYNDPRDSYGAVGPGADGPLPPMSSSSRDVPRPPASVPTVASRMPPTVPMPKASPSRVDEARPLAERPAPKQQSAAVQTKPADPAATVPASPPPVIEAKPAAPQIQPTQPMPNVQGLE